MRELGVRDGVDVMPRIFWESACQSICVLVGFGLHRGDFGMCEKKGCVLWVVWGNVGVGWWGREEG